MAKLDPLSKVGIVLVIVVALVGGLGVWWWSQQPARTEGGGPTATTSSPAVPTPEPTCEAGTDPCTPEVAAEQAETRALRAEAERVARSSYAERVRLTRDGGAMEPSEELKRYADGNYLRSLVGGLQHQKEGGYTVIGEPQLVLSPAPGESRKGSDPRLTLGFCEDNTQTKIVAKDQSKSQGPSGRGHLFIGHVDGQLKIVEGTVKAVESCG